MLAVDADVARTEARLAGRELACPKCGDRLGPWGWARSRMLRSLAGPVAVRPRRAPLHGLHSTSVAASRNTISVRPV